MLSDNARLYVRMLILLCAGVGGFLAAARFPTNAQEWVIFLGGLLVVIGTQLGTWLTDTPSSAAARSIADAVGDAQAKPKP